VLLALLAIAAVVLVWYVITSGFQLRTLAEPTESTGTRHELRRHDEAIVAGEAETPTVIYVQAELTRPAGLM
jgi:hypothetical protein